MSVFNIIQCLVIGAALTFGIWGELDPKGLILFIFFLIIFEAAILIKTRLSVECVHCGFDAYLYLKDQNKACEKVKAHMEVRGQDPDVWLARKVPIRLPSRKLKKNSTRETVV